MSTAEASTTDASTTDASRRRIVDVLTLTPLQTGLYALAQAREPGAVDPYTIQFVADIDGPLDVDRLRRATVALLDRHPNLRVSFWDRDLPHPVQIVPDGAAPAWREVTCARTELDALADRERRVPFDLAAGPAMRFALATTEPGHHRLIGTVHHIVVDGWSVPTMLRDLVAGYLGDGRTDHLPAVRPYRDYVAWLGRQDPGLARSAWRDYLGGLAEPSILAPGRRGTAAALPVSVEVGMDAADTARLVGWARESGLTVNTLAQFAWAVLLGRLTDRRDVVFGATVAGRPEQLTGVEDMVGLFINTVPVRARLDTAHTVRQGCVDLQRRVVGMRAHGGVGLAALQRLSGHPELFDTLMVFQNAPRGSMADVVRAPDGVVFTPLRLDSLTHYPLTLVPYLADGELRVVLEHRADLLPTIDPGQLGERLLQVLRSLPGHADADPDTLDILLPGERTILLTPAKPSRGPDADAESDEGGAQRTPTGPPAPAEAGRTAGSADAGRDEPATVGDLFWRHVQDTPAALAMTWSTGPAAHADPSGGAEPGRLGYGELGAAAARLAYELGARGVGQEDAVVIALPRGPRFVVALLAVALAGGTSVPVEWPVPAARLATLVDRTSAVLAIAAADALPGRAVPVLNLDGPGTAASVAGRPAERPAVRVLPDQALYTIFTSGSTGEPRGVVGTHRGIAALLADHRARVYEPAARRLGRPLRVGHAWSMSFDASWQPTLALLAGHALHVFDAEEQRDPARLVDGVRRFGLDMIETSPSMFGHLAQAGLLEATPDGERCPLAVLGLGGDAVGPDVWDRLRALPTTAVHNFYGPTETTVDAASAALADTAEPSIGHPVAGMRSYVLDSRLRLAPSGVVGELYLGGDQLTRGYLGRPGHTAGRFVADPFQPGERMYRTGDVVRRAAAGTLEYLGRDDDQVKIRGYRVEPAEIEAAVRAVPGVSTAVVRAVARGAGQALVAFVVPAGGVAAPASPSPATLRAQLADRLPAHLVPARFVLVDTLPMTANGKVDARALEALAAGGPGGVGVGAAEAAEAQPATATERALWAVATELLGAAPAGVDADLADLGLDSISMIALVSRARAVGVVLTPRLVAVSRGIRDLAEAADALAARTAAGGANGPAGLADEGLGAVPPLPIATWLLELRSFRRFTQTQLLAVPPGTGTAGVEAALQMLLDRHPMLRAALAPAGDALETHPVGAVKAADVLRVVPGDAASALGAEARATIDRVDPGRGRMLAALYLPDADLLQLSVHHLAVDAVSWAIMLRALARPSEATGELTSYRRFGELARRRAQTDEVAGQVPYWAAELAGADRPLGSRRTDPARDRAADLTVATFAASPEATAALVGAVSREVGLRELLLAALGWAVRHWRAALPDVVVDLESHGRFDHLVAAAGDEAAGADRPPANDANDVDTSATVGWFTSVFPFRVPTAPEADGTPEPDGGGAHDGMAEADGAGTPDGAAEADGARGSGGAEEPAADEGAALWRAAAATARRLAAVPNQGFDFGLAQSVRDDPRLRAAAVSPIEFNYLGRFDQRPDAAGGWAAVTDRTLHDLLPADPEPDLPLRYDLEVICAVGSVEGPGSPAALVTTLRANGNVLAAADLDVLGGHLLDAVALLAGSARRR
ncbi:non-ribosomal peptide synthetase [Pseudofrankia sp. BMG5.37]|uniref:non-ribosomal peptide synthetase n=1 Tax=Pseudofrankia sp. BMG5.37 TaxID=3050035 RepID=UPI002895B35A|nr:non-ribosomal peptide synthetase [Pseudofrankia sp. BMG5.37]MDT3439454.1 amino acid adenylation domain-containing protein [Pseudofrankia sp. BMG5.37]